MFNRYVLAFVVACLGLAPEIGLAEVTVAERLAPDQPLAVIAHRAVGGGAPENSLAGIQHAIDRGIDMVEVDIQKTRDGGYILVHDPTLMTTTNASEVFPEGAPAREKGDPYARQYRVLDFTLDDIARLRLKDPQGGDHPVPTLDAALDLADGRLLVLLELKNWDVDSLAPLLRRYDTRTLLLWTQGDRRKLAETARAAGIGVEVDLGAVSDIASAHARMSEIFDDALTMIGVRFSVLTPELVSEADALGVRLDVDARYLEARDPDGTVAPWVEAAVESGVAAVWTREPDALLDVLGR